MGRTYGAAYLQQSSGMPHIVVLVLPHCLLAGTAPVAWSCLSNTDRYQVTPAWMATVLRYASPRRVAISQERVYRAPIERRITGVRLLALLAAGVVIPWWVVIESARLLFSAVC